MPAKVSNSKVVFSKTSNKQRGHNQLKGTRNVDMRKCWNLTQIVKEEKTNLGCNYLKARTRKRYISQKNRFRDKFLNGDSHSQSPLNIL